MKLNFSDFKFTQISFEVRYENAYILWDRAGTIWKKFTTTWPNLKTEKIEPSQCIFTLETNFRLGVNLDKSFITNTNPTSSLNIFIEMTHEFITSTIQYLEISSLNRVGLRLIYEKDFPSKSEAANALFSTKMMSTPEGKHFNVQGKYSLPRYSLLWEGASTGVRILLEAQERKIDFESNPPIEGINPVHLEKHILVYDLDYYTIAKVSIGQLNVKEWISQNCRVLRRDAGIFLGGN